MQNNGLHNNIINKGLDYIARNLDERESVYTIAICSYILQITNHPSKQTAFNLLDSKAKTSNDTKWWARDTPSNETNNPWNKLPKSMDIETTSYALLTFLEAGLTDDAIPVVNWLVNQQNNLGGFTSSQDTVIGLYALYKLVTKLSLQPNIQIQIGDSPRQTNNININQNNAMIVQKLQVSIKIWQCRLGQN